MLWVAGAARDETRYDSGTLFSHPAELKMHKLPALLLVAVSLLTQPASAAPSGAFSKGATRLSVVLGAGYSFDEEYVILGVGAGYYLLDGLELGLNVQTWLGGDPDITQITPELTYVLQTKANFNPYAGVLYRRTLISGLDDLSAYGGRAGLYIPAGNRLFIGAGGVWMKYLDCEESQYRDCSDGYPELTFSFMF